MEFYSSILSSCTTFFIIVNGEGCLCWQRIIWLLNYEWRFLAWGHARSYQTSSKLWFVLLCPVRFSRTEHACVNLNWTDLVFFWGGMLKSNIFWKNFEFRPRFRQFLNKEACKTEAELETFFHVLKKV